MKNLNKYLLLIIALLDYVWLKSSWGKLSGGKFVSTMGGTLGKFASNNPYPWMKDFLQSIAIPNSVVFGNLTMWGETLSAILILAGLLLVWTKNNRHLARLTLAAGLLGGAFLNAVFYFGAGWTGASTESLNLLMCLVQLIALWAVLS